MSEDTNVVPPVPVDDGKAKRKAVESVEVTPAVEVVTPRKPAPAPTATVTVTPVWSRPHNGVVLVQTPTGYAAIAESVSKADAESYEVPQGSIQSLLPWTTQNGTFDAEFNRVAWEAGLLDKADLADRDKLADFRRRVMIAAEAWIKKG